eukprot:CAMPEP_0198237540 /NCGR_PEP_ID=MMETSP1446-20131203/3343_1 /TAXON_ID=1461542 ORGANISM="Unidentified sp, Strain CCMP2111" /NCGR_SAMPLE_ID=MMETSP1446 /ASSEMBLY_ACC=CAM_ASM_001112 /LENGTH=209 /DNA_ID=CAMNT_0043919709 /DNA_START=267 /DNA_END=896 /DNA_ORIENTATION=+
MPVSVFAAQVSHGVFMTVGWFVFLYVGSFAAKRIPQGGKKMLYAHIASQMIGLVLCTIGLIIGCELFDVPYQFISYRHGTLGLAVMALAYLQGVTGFLRPKKLDGKTHREQSGLRRAFEIGHGVLGKVVLILAIVNCFTGMILVEYTVTVEKAEVWAGVCIAVIAVAHIMDWAYDKFLLEHRPNSGMRTTGARADREQMVEIATTQESC